MRTAPDLTSLHKGSGVAVHKGHFFDVRVFNPSTPTHRNTQPSTLYQRNEREKHRQYLERVCEVERGFFTPLVFATTGGMGSNASTTYKGLASLLATKRKESYSLTMAWIRAQLSFALLRSCVFQWYPTNSVLSVQYFFLIVSMICVLSSCF